MIPHTSPILYFTLSGFLLRFSWPPFDVPLSLAAGLILSAAAISNANYKHSIIGGAIVGGLWNSYLLIGLLPWGIYFAFGAWLISVFIMSIFYLLTKIIYTKMTPALGGISISLAWTCIMYITQTLHYPIALTPTLVRSTPEIASSLSNLGFFAGEFLIILFTFSATLYFYQLRFALIALLVATALRNWLLILNNETPETHTDIAIVQPAIRAESFFAASNNLYQRRKIEKSLDNLTYSAASQNAQLIVWPEAANGLPNFNLPNRVKTTRNILSQTKSELLITGYEYNSAGKKFNTAYLISSDSAIQRAQKKITVPLIESNLARGREKTFESKIGRIGVAICFEGLFNSQFKNLAEQQADYFFVLTDDSSMRNSNIPSIHTSYAILFSKIYKKPLVFSNNNSVSFTSNSLGEVTSIDREGNIPKVNYWKLSTKKTDASWIIFNQEAVIAFISALVLVCARNV